jgi:hypothetical protein
VRDEGWETFNHVCVCVCKIDHVSGAVYKRAQDKQKPVELCIRHNGVSDGKASEYASVQASLTPLFLWNSDMHRTQGPSACLFWLMFERCRVQTWAQRLPILTAMFRDIPQSVQAINETVTEVGPQLCD